MLLVSLFPIPTGHCFHAYWDLFKSPNSSKCIGFFNKLKIESVLASEALIIPFQFSDAIEICSWITFENLSLLASLRKLPIG